MVTIAGRLFKSKKAAKAEYARIRDHGIQNENDREFLKAAAGAHIKIIKWLRAHDGEIHDIYIGPGAGGWSSKAVHVVMHGEDDAKYDDSIGPENCIDGLFGEKGKTREELDENYYRRKRNQLAREALEDQRFAYLNAQPRDVDGRYTCAGCGIMVDKAGLDVDHKVLLEDILRAFDESDPTHPGATFKDADPLLLKWLHFHRDKCVYQILCRDKCHRGTIADGGKTAAETSARAKQKRKRD
jgi:hypothetical protein